MLPRPWEDRVVTSVPRRLLDEDERVVLELRPHARATIGPALLLLVLAPATTFAVTVLPEGERQAVLRLAVVALAGLVLARFSVWPFLRWLATTYAVTDRRLVVRWGVLARRSRDLALERVTGVGVEQGGVLDRALRCGTLVVERGSEADEIVLHRVPRVREMARDMTRLVEADRRRRGAQRW